MLTYVGQNYYVPELFFFSLHQQEILFTILTPLEAKIKEMMLVKLPLLKKETLECYPWAK